MADTYAQPRPAKNSDDTKTKIQKTIKNPIEVKEDEQFNRRYYPTKSRYIIS